MNNFKIVLVEPKYAMNVGSVARSMYCMGFYDLSIVNPLCEISSSDARKFSLFARDEVLLKSKKYNSLKDLKNSDTLLFSFTRRIGKKHRSNPLLLSQIFDFIKDKEKDICLVFGGESSGLNNEDISLSDYIVNFDTNIVKESMSLPMSVVIVLYEIRRNLLLFENKFALSPHFKAKASLLSKLIKYLKKLDYIDKSDSQNMLTVFEKMINKLDDYEVKVMFSVIQEIERYGK